MNHLEYFRFSPSGALYVDCTTPDSYKVDETGV